MINLLNEQSNSQDFRLVIWTDSSSAQAIVHRLGTGKRAKHLEIQGLWLQEQSRSKFIAFEKVGTHMNTGDALTKYVPRAILDRLSQYVGYSFPDEANLKFQEFRNIKDTYAREAWSSKWGKEAYEWTSEDLDEGSSDLDTTLALIMIRAM